MAKKKSKKTTKRLSFSEFDSLEENILNVKLGAARATVPHAGEKGRGLEIEASNLLRSFLPAEYGLGTGFIAFSGKGRKPREEPLLSSQLDIIIYDALRGGPIATTEACQVYPLEHVYGYVEVKAQLKATWSEAKRGPTNTLAGCIHQAHKLGQLRRRWWTLPDPENPTGRRYARYEPLSPTVDRRQGHPPCVTHRHRAPTSQPTGRAGLGGPIPQGDEAKPRTRARRVELGWAP